MTHKSPTTLCCVTKKVNEEQAFTDLVSKLDSLHMRLIRLAQLDCAIHIKDLTLITHSHQQLQHNNNEQKLKQQ